MDSNELIERVFDARQCRVTHPDGTFDKGGRWWPSQREQCECCNRIRTPSRRWPYSLLVHCRSKGHIWNLVEKLGPSDPQLLKEAAEGQVRLRPKPNRACANGIGFKILAVGNDGRLYSVYDGSPWLLGQKRVERALKDHNGGLYVYETPSDALRSIGQFPTSSRLLDAPKVLVKCKVGGSYCRYGKKLAFSRVTPINIERILSE